MVVALLLSEFLDENNEDGDYGILVMATDGLWDVSENDAVARTVFQTLDKYPTEKHRYTMVAQELVARARGKINDSGHWRLADSKAAATVDDISVIVIPVYQYYKEHVEWEKRCAQVLQERRAKVTQSATEACEDETLLVNGVTKAQVEVEHNDAEEEEEAVLEVNKQQAQATVELEEDASQKAQGRGQTDPLNVNQAGTTTSEKDVKDLIENELSAAISALDATESTDHDRKEAKGK